jgi:hypothetical protein
VLAAKEVALDFTRTSEPALVALNDATLERVPALQLRRKFAAEPAHPDLQLTAQLRTTKHRVKAPLRGDFALSLPLPRAVQLAPQRLDDAQRALQRFAARLQRIARARATSHTRAEICRCPFGPSSHACTSRSRRSARSTSAIGRTCRSCNARAACQSPKARQSCPSSDVRCSMRQLCCAISPRTASSCRCAALTAYSASESAEPPTRRAYSNAGG